MAKPMIIAPKQNSKRFVSCSPTPSHWKITCFAIETHCQQKNHRNQSIDQWAKLWFMWGIWVQWKRAKGLFASSTVSMKARDWFTLWSSIKVSAIFSMPWCWYYFHNTFHCHGNRMKFQNHMNQDCFSDAIYPPFQSCIRLPEGNEKQWFHAHEDLPAQRRLPHLHFQIYPWAPQLCWDCKYWWPHMPD